MRIIKALAIVAAVTLAASAAGAQQGTTCKVQAGEKKLAGAALSSFLKKCSGDATAACSKQADDKKLSGAARTSFTKKCVSDATGS